MKKIFKTLAIVAVAALGFACQNEIDEQVNGNEGEKVTVEVVGSIADLTRSVFGETPNTQSGTVSSTWRGDETVGFSVNGAAWVDDTNEVEGNNAEFDVELTAATEGYIYAASPRNTTQNFDLGGVTSVSGGVAYYLTIPAEQTPLTGSVDESTHLLFGKHAIDGSIPETVQMAFNHIAAYGKMHIKEYKGNGIKSVTITAESDDLAAKSLKYVFADGSFDKTANSYEAYKTITIDATNVVYTEAEGGDVWFTCLPGVSDKMAGNMTVVITDNDDTTYTKELDTIGKLAFIQGQVSAFTVNMKDVAAVKVEPYEVVPVGVGLDANKQEVTLSWTYGENNNFTTTIVKSSAQTAPREDPDGQLRMYQGNELTFTAESGSIVKIEMTVTQVESNTLTADKGALAYENGVITWTGQVSEVVFTTSAKIFMNPIKVYYSDEDPIVAQPLNTPEILAEVQNTTEVYVIWSDVENAVNYTVSCGGLTQTIAAGVEEATFTDLAYSTNYTISVTANPEVGSLYYAASEAATTTVKTGADSANYSGSYLIVAQKDGKYYYMSTWKDGQDIITGGNNRTAVDSGVTEITDYTSEADFANTLDMKYVWTIASVDGGYTIANSDSSAWLYLGENQNRAKMTTNESLKETFTISKEDNVYTIKATSYTRTLALNKDNINSLFNCYASGDYVYDLVLIPYTGTVKVKEATTIELGTYENTVDVKEGAEAATDSFVEPIATVKASGSPIDVTLTYTFSGDDVIEEIESDGNVIFNGKTGSVTITISYAGDDNYKGCEVEYTVEVDDTTPIEGAGKPYSYTFTSKQFSANGSLTLNGLSWTLAGNGNYWGYDGTKGQQFGSGSAPYKSLTLSTNGYAGGVKTIVINTSGASSIKANMTVTVGGTQIGDTISLTSSATSYTLKSDVALTGEIVISYTQTSSKAIYIKSIAIN